MEIIGLDSYGGHAGKVTSYLSISGLAVSDADLLKPEHERQRRKKNSWVTMDVSRHKILSTGAKFTICSAGLDGQSF
jgi:hypothetical protein